MRHTAVIEECTKAEQDDRPVKEQKWCLLTQDESRVLGRHPTKEDAAAQERAIHSGATMPYTRVIYKGAVYCLAEHRPAIMGTPKQSLQIQTGLLTSYLDALFAALQPQGETLSINHKQLEDLRGKIDHQLSLVEAIVERMP